MNDGIYGLMYVRRLPDTVAVIAESHLSSSGIIT